jgi:hypothetical protein
MFDTGFMPFYYTVATRQANNNDEEPRDSRLVGFDHRPPDRSRFMGASETIVSDRELWMLTVVIAIALSIIARTAWGNRRARRKQSSRGRNAVDETSATERRLLTACSGQRDVVERLIQYERSRSPNLSRRVAAEAALDRLRSDRR